MRTLQRCTFEQQTSEINKNLSHIVFIIEQFKLDNEEISSNNQNKLTTEVYSENQYASQFNTKLSQLPTQALQTQEYLLDALFVFINTYFEIYLREVYLFIKDNFDDSLPQVPEAKIFENILQLLKIDLEKDLDNLNASTYEYFRLRRNAIVHRAKGNLFQGVLHDLITGHFKNKKNNFRQDQLNGNELNTQWRKHSVALAAAKKNAYAIHQFDFARRKEGFFTINDLSDIFSFYRLFVKEIDSLILSKLVNKDLISFCKKHYLDEYGQIKGTEFDKFKVRFERSARFQLNFLPTSKEVQEVYNDA